MSMTAITVFQIIALYCAYTIITILIPHIVVGKTLNLKSRYEKFMAYSVIGNFYVINLVYVLELLHISYPVTLILFTLIPCAIIKIKLEHIPFLHLCKEQWELIRRLVGGQQGLKAYRDQRRPLREARREKRRKHFKEVYLYHLPEVLLIFLILLIIMAEYGSNLLTSYGYKASDLIVHNYWINGLDENELFVAGIYPMGFHNMLYYIHAIFGFDTYVLLRVGSLIQFTWIIFMLLCFMKLICRSKYLPFAGTFLFLATNLMIASCYSRYHATLPQEYGMIFILPAIYAGFAYFRAQIRAQHGDGSKRPFWYLCMFAASFSLAFTVHFYGFFIAAFYCVAMAIGFVVWLFRKPFFKRIMLTVLISIAIALFPMVTAFFMGTELQGSLAWGLSVIVGHSVSLNEGQTIGTDGQEEDEIVYYYDTDSNSAEGNTALTDTAQETAEETSGDEESSPGLIARLLTFPSCAKAVLNEFVFNEKYHSYTGGFLLITLLLGVMGIGLMISPFKDKVYGAQCLSTSIYMMLLVFMLAAGRMGLPSLMDGARGSIFTAYSVPIVIALFLDCCLTILGTLLYRVLPVGVGVKAVVSETVGITILSAGALWVGISGNWREHYVSGGMTTNASIVCLTNIIRNEKDYTWTIVSCNDENRMMYGHGFHYETYTFLRAMENSGSQARIRIPTETVYFFIEKIPVDYSLSYEGSGRTVSEEGAIAILPYGSGLSKYQGENRYKIMCRMYYWAQAFAELYPNEMYVYYETDDFICYRCEQNPYRVFNFAIDYYYNTVRVKD